MKEKRFIGVIREGETFYRSHLRGGNVLSQSFARKKRFIGVIREGEMFCCRHS